MNKKKNLQSKMVLKNSLSIRIESVYLIKSNKERVAILLKKESLETGDIIDVLISLHVILEVGLNILFRQISLSGIKKGIDAFEITKNLDNISFIDKTILFIYNSKFNFDGKLDEATRHHSIINKLKDFAALRNQLLHGHSISTIIAGGVKRDSPLKSSLNRKTLDSQIQKFKDIMEGMRFYLDYLDSSLTEHGRNQYKKSYLNDDFLVI